MTEDQAVAEFGAASVKTKYARFPSMLYAFNADENRVKTGAIDLLAMLLAAESWETSYGKLEQKSHDFGCHKESVY